MDIRIVKTKKAIKEAFLQFRFKKALDKITVKEICRTAQINKSTFYSHYSDIYALSEEVEKETVEYILNGISQNREYSTDNPQEFAREICMTCISHLPLTELLFAGQENSRLADRLEEGIKEMIYQKYPEYRNDVNKNILLSFCIQGAHHAYLSNRSADPELLVQNIETIIKKLQPLYEKSDGRDEA